MSGLGLARRLPARRRWCCRSACVIRRGLPETLHHHAEARGAPSGALDARRANLPVLLLGFGLVAATTVSTYVFNFMTTFAMTTLHMSAGKSLLATVVERDLRPGGRPDRRHARRTASDAAPLMIWPRVAFGDRHLAGLLADGPQPRPATLLGATAVMTFSARSAPPPP